MMTAQSDPGKGPPHHQRAKARPRGRHVTPSSTQQAVTTPTVLLSHPQTLTRPAGAAVGQATGRGSCRPSLLLPSGQTVSSEDSPAPS